MHIVLIMILLISIIPEKVTTANADFISSDNGKQNATKVERKEIISERSQKSKTYINNNGTYTKEIRKVPIHYFDKKNEKWEDFDTKLIKVNKDEYRNIAGEFITKFPQSAKKDKAIATVEENQYEIALIPSHSDLDNQRNDFKDSNGITQSKPLTMQMS